VISRCLRAALLAKTANSLGVSGTGDGWRSICVLTIFDLLERI
jgi:hypothetical protein